MQITTITQGWQLIENKGMGTLIDHYTVAQLVSEEMTEYSNYATWQCHCPLRHQRITEIVKTYIQGGESP